VQICPHSPCGLVADAMTTRSNVSCRHGPNTSVRQAHISACGINEMTGEFSAGGSDPHWRCFWQSHEHQQRASLCKTWGGANTCNRLGALSQMLRCTAEGPHLINNLPRDEKPGVHHTTPSHHSSPPLSPEAWEEMMEFGERCGATPSTQQIRSGSGGCRTESARLQTTNSPNRQAPRPDAGLKTKVWIGRKE
jgi:hypothetical protein